MFDAENQDRTPTAHNLSLSGEGGALFVVMSGKHLAIRDGSPFFDQAVAAYRERDWNRLWNILQPGLTVETFMNPARAEAYLYHGNVAVRDGMVLYKDKPLEGVLVDWIFEFIEKDLDALPLVKFLNRLKQNCSMRTQETLPVFMREKGMMVDEDGFLMGFKSVRPDFKDWHSGTVDYTPGNVVKMERGEVDDDRTLECSFGYHVGTFQYATTFHGGETILLCRVPPEAVVSVPDDAVQGKIRTCELEVVCQIASPERPETRLYQESPTEGATEEETEYEVVVGNIGTVYRGTDREIADAVFDDYETLALGEWGRAAGESVRLLEVGGDIEREYDPAENTEEDEEGEEEQSVYEVEIEGRGNAYVGYEENLARDAFKEAVSKSLNNYGSYGGTNVYLKKDGTVLRTYEGG